MDRAASPNPLRQPHAALADLCDGLFSDVAFLEACPRLEPDQLPAAAGRLLAHREHMTSALERHYGKPVDLHVVTELRDGDYYRRRILLTLRGEPTIVELGIVRISLRYLTEPVRSEVLSQGAPLGDILIRHNVLRRISPRWYFEFPGGTPIAATWGGGSGTYGRVGTIYCDDEPAIDLLECIRP